MAALASDWLRHFQLLLNRWAEFNETWQEARSQRPLPSLCFSGQSEKQDGRPGLWLAETFSTSPLNPLNKIQWNMTGSKISTSSTKFFVFLCRLEKQDGHPSLWLAEIFSASPLKPQYGIQLKLTGSKMSTSSTKFVFFSGQSEKQDGCPGLWYAETFSTSPFKPLKGIQRNLAGSKISTSSTNFGVFRADRKNKMAALASDWLRHFQRLLWNRCMKFKETWQEARSQRPLPILCFSGWLEKKDGCPGLWLAETISTSPLKPLSRIQRNLTGSKISTSSTKFVFSGWSEKQNGCPGLWLAETFSTSPLNPLNKIQWNMTGSKISTSSTKFCVFCADWKNKMAVPACDWLRYFQLLLWNHSMEFNKSWQEARCQRPLPSLCFSGQSEKQDGCPGLWYAETFSTSPFKPLKGIQRNLTGSKISTSSTNFGVFRADRKNKMAALASDWLRHFKRLLWNRCMEFKETWQEARSQRPLPFFVFRADRKKKMAALASDWLRQFQLLFLNRWAEFNETSQEARSQRPLPSLCFSEQSEKQDGHPGLWLAQTFSTSPLNPLNKIQWNMTGSKISTSSTKFCVFCADWKNKMAALASDWLRYFQLLLWNHSMEFNKSWQEARCQRPLPSLCFFRANRKNKMASDMLRHFWLLLSNPWREFNETWLEARSQRPLPIFGFFGPISKQKWWQILLRCTICGPLGLLLLLKLYI